MPPTELMAGGFTQAKDSVTLSNGSVRRMITVSEGAYVTRLDGEATWRNGEIDSVKISPTCGEASCTAMYGYTSPPKSLQMQLRKTPTTRPIHLPPPPPPSSLPIDLSSLPDPLTSLQSSSIPLPSDPLQTQISTSPHHRSHLPHSTSALDSFVRATSTSRTDHSTFLRRSRSIGLQRTFSLTRSFRRSRRGSCMISATA